MVIFFKEEANRKHLGCWTSSHFLHDTSRNIAWDFVWFFLSDKKMEAAQVFIKTEEEEEEKEDVLMDNAQG